REFTTREGSLLSESAAASVYSDTQRRILNVPEGELRLTELPVVFGHHLLYK
ncbi:hypothetical protein BaRGS_00031774, partial [Batillaria attramentaria]